MARRKTTNPNEELVITEKDIEKNKKDNINRILKGKIVLEAKTQSQKELLKLIKEKNIIMCSGISGSGKTFVSLAEALRMLKDGRTNYTNIYLLKSVTSLKGEDIGYIKGDVNDKLEPHMWSYFINIQKVIGDKYKKLIEEKHIIPFPLAFLRGVSIDDAIIILDEAQNIDLVNLRTVMTRISKSSKLIVLGDVNQIDMKKREESSLETALEIFKDVPEIGTIYMDEDDENIRNPIIKIIEKKFQEYDENERKNKRVSKKTKN